MTPLTRSHDSHPFVIVRMPPRKRHRLACAGVRFAEPAGNRVAVLRKSPLTVTRERAVRDLTEAWAQWLVAPPFPAGGLASSRPRGFAAADQGLLWTHACCLLKPKAAIELLLGTPELWRTRVTTYPRDMLSISTNVRCAMTRGSREFTE